MTAMAKHHHSGLHLLLFLIIPIITSSSPSPTPSPSPQHPLSSSSSANAPASLSPLPTPPSTTEPPSSPSHHPPPSTPDPPSSLSPHPPPSTTNPPSSLSPHPPPSTTNPPSSLSPHHPPSTTNPPSSLSPHRPPSTTNPPSSLSPHPPTSTTRSPPPVRPSTTDAVISAGDLWNWISILSGGGTDQSKVSGTVFIPEEATLSNSPALDPFIFPYHIVPQRLSFSDLELLRTNARLPTLLPRNSILITNSSRANFTLDDSPLTRPDLYVTPSVVVHGIRSILNYSLYGDEHQHVPPRPPQPSQQSNNPSRPSLSGSVATCTASIDFAVVLFLVAYALLSPGLY